MYVTKDFQKNAEQTLFWNDIEVLISCINWILATVMSFKQISQVFILKQEEKFPLILDNQIHCFMAKSIGNEIETIEIPLGFSSKWILP